MSRTLPRDTNQTGRTPTLQRTARLLAAAAATALVAAVVFARPEPADTSAPAVTTQELVFFTADGPVRVRLTVTLDGKPAEGPWRAALDTLFAHCDRNGDGALDANERTMFRNGNRGDFNQFVIIDGVGYQVPRMPSVSFPEKNGKVDRDGFRDGFALSGSGPVSVTPVAPRGDSAALTDALFKRLDTDGDGKLSADELRAARDRLAAIDVNEDELIAADELLGRFTSPYQYAIAFADLDGTVRQPQPPPLPEVLTGPPGRPLTAKDLLAARDKDKDRALTAAELGCDAKFFAELDADGDGKLDAEELAAWLRSPPDLELAFTLTDPEARDSSWLPVLTTYTRPKAKLGVKVVGKGRFADKAKTTADGAVVLELRDVRFRFAAEEDASARQRWQSSAEQLRQVFGMLAGKTGEIDRKKVAENPETAGVIPLFDFADRDGNGKLTKAELDRALRTGEGLVNCRVAVTVADQGRGLFELLDRDGDGRLSPRELNAAVGLIAALDRDGDGKLARNELPRGYAVTAKPASIELIPTGAIFGDSVVEYVGAARPVRTAAVPDVPEWFRAMDRNGDGDVSAKEFTGPPALFKKIDADGDGLISPEEARAFEKAKGK